jgi:hypothetical protein
MRSEFDHLIGKPFERYGRGPDVYDCWGIVIESGRMMGLKTPDYRHIPMDDSRRVWYEVAQAMPNYQKTVEPSRGDLVLFKSMNGEAHFARMINASEAITSNEDLGCHIFDVNGPQRHFIKGFYRCLSE